MGEHLDKLKEMMSGICENHQAELSEFNGEYYLLLRG